MTREKGGMSSTLENDLALHFTRVIFICGSSEFEVKKDVAAFAGEIDF